MKKTVLVFCDFYLPGFKSGGGMWTVVNLVDRFHDRYEFFVVTRNYESKGDTTPYTSVRTGAWNEVGNAKVFYLSKEHFSTRQFVALFSEVRPDLVFLNSALSLPVVRFLTVRRKKIIPPVPVVLAPCGEFSSGALSIKPMKKKLFLAWANTVGLYKDVVWKASFDSEADEIRKTVKGKTNIMVAPDLAPRTILRDLQLERKPSKSPGSAKFVFLSRITSKKNLLYFIERLAEVKHGNVELEILGPVEDNDHWQQCLAAVKLCPPNVRVHAKAEFVPYDQGLEHMVNSHFFVLPTLGENFGYVLIESLAAGTPILVSDKTSWDQLEKNGIGWATPLEDEGAWQKAINRCVDMDQEEFSRMSAAARRFAMDWLNSPEIEDATAQVLELAVSGRAPATANV
jgi:glycosyltransferase involved in cell wall biosynthesis